MNDNIWRSGQPTKGDIMLSAGTVKRGIWREYRRRRYGSRPPDALYLYTIKDENRPTEEQRAFLALLQIPTYTGLLLVTATN